MRAGIGRNAAISGGLHLLILLAFIIVIPPPSPPPTPPDDGVEVEFEGTAASAQKSDRTGHHAAVTEADEPAKDLPAEKPPTKQPIQAPTAPPPPPPPPPPAPQPEEVKTLEKVTLPPPPPTEAAIALKPPPTMKVAATRQPPTPSKPAETVTHQPHPTKLTSNDSRASEVNLDNIMQHLMKNLPPSHLTNAERGGAHDAGGQKHGNLTGSLSEGQRKTIGDSVRRCYSEDTAAKDYATYSAEMEVTVDASGVVHDVRLLSSALARAGSDPAYRAFAERAERAVLDPQCATLPLPPSVLGQPSAKFSFRFRP